MLTGHHLIAGIWVAGENTFRSSPADGPSHSFSVGSPDHVDLAAQAAEAAFQSYRATSDQKRAEFLNKIADEIDVRGAEITEIGTQETGLPIARLEGERGRTTGQLRLFAAHILQGDYLDRRHDAALPDRQPLPRPDLKMIQRPIGPVAVFGASNFPLAFSVAGGDTASALAAGCPVVVKGHSAHPGTSEVVADAILAAIKACALNPGIFSLIQGGRRDVGQALVQHSLINAVGFTGSLVGGRALFDLCSARPTPIPFFGELGSVNPMFILPNAMANRGAQIGNDWAASLVIGAGQFCTNPGVAVVINGAEADAFAAAAGNALGSTGEQTMLTDGIADAFRAGQAHLSDCSTVTEVISSPCQDRSCTPALYEVSGADWLSNPSLHEEAFGPLGLIVRASDSNQMTSIAHSLSGQLTCTLHTEDKDLEAAQMLLSILERKAGRLLFNGFPTGVEVSDAMVHGGPYPASTNFGATSVGTLSIRRWLRPVCYQNVPRDCGYLEFP